MEELKEKIARQLYSDDGFIDEWYWNESTHRQEYFQRADKILVLIKPYLKPVEKPPVLSVAQISQVLYESHYSELRYAGIDDSFDLIARAQRDADMKWMKGE